ncbi:MAG: DUF1559 domain-containing protein [Phycisphaerae bacterium]|nr:DUF1559 domain-containing protein [Phycisphaerae bacterium]
MTRRSFTLIELLVVVAVIALLISILVPSLKAARDRAKATVCMSNLHQMGLALTMYGMDYKEAIPPSDCPFADSPEGSWWLHSLQPYSKTRLLYRCPADRSDNFLNWDDPRDVARSDELRWASFSTNGLLDDPNANAVSKVKHPPYVIWVLETPDNTAGSIHVHPENYGWGEDPNNNVAHKRHADKSNYLFVDSHVAVVKIEETWEPNQVNLWHPKHAPEWWHLGMDMPW